MANVNIQISAESEDLIPTYALPGDAGADLKSSIDITIAAGKRTSIPTGVKIAIPEGYVGLVHPRSGLASKYGITVLNAPGTIDSGYRGEINVILLNTNEYEFEVKRGDRIAQLVIQAVDTAVFELVDVLDETVRGEGGLGSTGLSS